MYCFTLTLLCFPYPEFVYVIHNFKVIVAFHLSCSSYKYCNTTQHYNLYCTADYESI